MMAGLSSCTTMSKFSQSVKAKSAQLNAKPKRNLPAMAVVPDLYEEIEFLDNISVKPGRVYMKKASDALEAEPVLVRSEASNKMPDNLTDVEKAN